MSWARISPYLEGHFSIYAMDRRGRRGSGDSAEYDFMREVEDVLAVLEAIGEPSTVFGHSFGGLICLEAAMLKGNLERLILYEPAIPVDTSVVPAGFIDRMQALIDQGELEAAMEILFREVVRMPDHEFTNFRQLPLWQARIAQASTVPRELRVVQIYRFEAEKFASLEIPTMLLVGSESPAFAHQEIDRIDATLPNSQVVVLPGQQHIAHLSTPEMVAGEVIRFLGI